jgi:hypothetical protein
MPLNIKDASVHEAVKQIAKITGESQAQAVATAGERASGQTAKGRSRGPAPGYRPQDREPNEPRGQAAGSRGSALRRARAPAVIVDTSAIIAILTEEDDAAV